MSKLTKRLQDLLHRYWVDALCLLLSLGFFGAFLHNSLGMNTGALGYRTRVANLMSGTVNRKSVDAPAFAEIHPQAPLYDRDAIWAPAGAGTVQIRLIDQTLFDISPGTLVVLKKQENLKAPGLAVDVVAGSVEIREISHQVAQGFTQFKVGDKPMPASELARGSKLSVGRDAQEPVGKPSPEPTPSATPSGQPSPAASPSVAPTGGAGGETGPVTAQGGGLIHPREGMTYYLMSSKEMEIVFSWPPSVRGDLVVRPAPGSAGEAAKIAAIRVKGAQPAGTRVKLKAGSLYEWSVVDGGGHPLHGPHQVTVEPYSGAQVLQSLNGADQGMVEIVQ
jgi:hypothetical protein